MASRNRSIVFILCMSLLATALFSDSLFGQITINRTDPVIERKTFDPKHRPSSMPALGPNESAVTESFFSLDSKVGGSKNEPAPGENGREASVKIDKIQMILHLRITIWLPENGNDKIVKHEEGHRKIAETFYMEAAAVAPRLADAMMGRTLIGRGVDANAAFSDALKKANAELGKQYLAATDAQCYKTQLLYDSITASGTNAVNEDSAIKNALEQAKFDASRENPSTP